MTKKKAVVIKKSKQKQSPLLILKGEPTDDIEKYLKLVRKNIPEPERWRRTQSSQWDYMISALDKGDSMPLERKIAGSVSARAKKLGYVVRLTKLDDEFTELWFGGFEAVPTQKK